MLNPDDGQNLNIREEADGEIYVESLTEVPIKSLEEATTMINAGMRYRQMASQKMNDTSSRSHTLLHVDIYK